MGRGQASHSDASGVLYGDAGPRSFSAQSRSITELRGDVQRLTTLSDDGLLGALKDDEIAALLSDPDIDSTLHKRLASLVKGWKAKINAGSKLLVDTRINSSSKLIERDITVTVSQVNSAGRWVALPDQPRKAAWLEWRRDRELCMVDLADATLIRP